jgi:O-antigen/teichoic acid export membrane protein
VSGQRAEAIDRRAGRILDAARRLHGASGAVGAQLAQALASLVLSIAAARALGADGLGVYGLISGGLVVGTALATGLVGDSLTVLDRNEPRVRAGLQLVAFSCAALGGVLGCVITRATGLLDWKTAFVFGLGCAFFIFEEFLRRLLMASLRFWSVMAVDVSCLIATVWWLVVANATGSVTMMQILLALWVSQIVAMITAFNLLPGAERLLAAWKHADIASVFRYGSWRAAQQGVRPAMLTAMRIIVAVAAGTVAYGRLEGARVYTAPTLLIVNGVGGFLFATFASRRERSLRRLTRYADKGAAALVGMVAVAGVVAVACLGRAGPIITGHKFEIDELAVVGWVAYAAAAGLLIPYGSLAAVVGMHVKVFMYRLVESIISLVAVVAVLYVFDASSSWVPLAMTIGPVALAVVIRQHVLLPSVEPEPEPEPALVFEGRVEPLAVLSDVLQPYTDVYMAGGAS